VFVVGMRVHLENLWWKNMLGNKAYYALVAVWSMSDLNRWRQIAEGLDNLF